MASVLNLSNEVVKMRGEVKRVKVLIIRKLTRQIFALKKKKGSDADLERNQRRAARLLEEIHALKALAPDAVTKAALQSDISFEKVCQNKDSSRSERATARIATHPEFSRKIRSIKNAVEAFKAERTSSDEKAGKKSNRQERESDLDSGDGGTSEEDEEDGDDGIQEKIQKTDDEESATLNKDPVISKKGSPDNAAAEVVRMRKEVKKLRVLIIRNLTQQISNLKKAQTDESEPKGKEDCVARMQQEVQVLRTLLPDQVTTRAIAGSAELEKALGDPESGAAERAVARIATHARFAKKLQDVRQAIEDEKVKAAKAGDENEVDEMRFEDVQDEKVGGTTEEEEDEEDKEVKESQVISVPKAEKLPESVNVAPGKEKPKTGEKGPADPKPIPKTAVKATRNPPKSKPPAPRPKPESIKPESSKDKDESDLSDSDGEKEYFDDSTEERFHKQSSYSEQSDDDFFLGKVSKLKKKKSDSAPRKESAAGAPKVGRENKAQLKVESVFCSSLSTGASQKAKRGGPEPRRFPNTSDEKPSGPKSRGFGRGFRNQPPGFREKAKGPGGERDGKGALERKKTGARSQHALHPSWEASRKRKEQQAQITAFQGKKIRFDHDD